MVRSGSVLFCGNGAKDTVARARGVDPAGAAPTSVCRLRSAITEAARTTNPRLVERREPISRMVRSPMSPAYVRQPNDSSTRPGEAGSGLTPGEEAEGGQAGQGEAEPAGYQELVHQQECPGGDGDGDDNGAADATGVLTGRSSATPAEATAGRAIQAVLRSEEHTSEL